MCFNTRLQFFACRAAALGVALLAAGSAVAAEAARVIVVQAPAWIERGATTEALARRTVLSSGDIIRTGSGGRVILRLEEGSLVKLGADADLDLTTLAPASSPAAAFEGVLDVLKGAFRFTTTLADRRRNVSARIRSATIGIRGTDVWGKAEESRDFVVLLEGAVTIERDGQVTALDQPLSLFMAPRGEPALPVGPVAQDDLARWAAETEPRAGYGVISEDGQYQLNLASFADEAGAEDLQRRVAGAGYAVSYAPVRVGERTWWRVSSAGYDTPGDASAAADAIGLVVPLRSPWVAREE